MEGTLRHRDRRDNPDGLMPKDDNSAREAIRKDRSPIPVLGNFPAKTIESISISSCFNKTNNNRFMRTNKMEDTRGGISYGDAPAIPTYDFSCIHRKQYENRWERDTPQHQGPAYPGSTLPFLGDVLEMLDHFRTRASRRASV